jgi:hypothetical protein
VSSTALDFSVERQRLLVTNFAWSGEAAAGRSPGRAKLRRLDPAGGKGVFQMKRLSGVTAALVFGVLALAGTAGATKPFMERVVIGPDTLSDTCSFPVLIQPTAPDVQNFFIFSNGEIHGSGPFVGTATNLDTDKTVKINLSGSFSVVEHSDGTTTITSNGFVLSTLFGTIFSGHGVLVLDASGNVISRTFNGRERDLCAELAGP